MKRTPLVSQGTLHRLLQSAEQAWRNREFDENIELLRRASRLDPANPLILLQLGRMLGLKWDYSEAKECFEKAIRIAGDKVDILTKAGIQCRDLRDPGLAENFFRRASDDKNATAHTMTYLAEILERLRRIPEAFDTIEKALQKDSACASALLAKARLLRQIGNLNEAESIVQFAVRNGTREVRIRALYEQAGILDRLGRHDEAMTSFQLAKALILPEAPPHRAELYATRERLANMRAGLSQAQLQRWIDAAPEFCNPQKLSLLCGHPRSGTTLLEQVLDSHPAITSAEESEVFHDYAYVPLTRGLPDAAGMLEVLERANVIDLQKSRDNYLIAVERLLGSPLDGRLVVDKNPSLTFLIPAFVRVFPEIKILVALRDPRDVCLSCFMQPFYPIGSTSSAYLTLAETIDEYVALMTNWLKFRPMLAGRFLEVRYEDMVMNLESVARDVMRFLEIEWNDKIVRFNEHAQKKVVRSPTYADVAKPLFNTAVGRWHPYAKFLEPYVEKLQPFISAFGYNK
ncbi:MAG TPA: sulfotransferase [Verrucomicrobiae bacterium]|nr:sulfotransferase [Verrucomicrobiae bacterium]